MEIKNVERLMEQLKADGSEFASKQYAILERMVRCLLIDVHFLDYQLNYVLFLESNIIEINIRTIETWSTFIVKRLFNNGISSRTECYGWSRLFRRCSSS
jgi:hypothetical protein